MTSSTFGPRHSHDTLTFRILEAGLTSAAVLISFGAVLGKLNPFQTLILAMIESTVFIANAYLGYKVLGVIDVGKDQTSMTNPFQKIIIDN